MWHRLQSVCLGYLILIILKSGVLIQFSSALPLGPLRLGGGIGWQSLNRRVAENAESAQRFQIWETSFESLRHRLKSVPLPPQLRARFRL